MGSPIRPFICLTAVLAAAGLADASAAAETARALQPAAPPRAYVEFCFRAPQECPSVATGHGDERGVKAAANAAFWRLAFAAAEPAAVSGPAVLRVSTPAAPASPRSRSLAQIEAINRSVNRAIAERSDMEIYGVSDHWALPLDGAVRQGDCEDFVLEKRRMLRRLGLAEQEMSIALVKTPWGQNHAVLIVSTAQGEMVLDNLSPRVEPWSRSSYSLIARQSSADPAVWLGAPGVDAASPSQTRGRGGRRP